MDFWQTLQQRDGLSDLAVALLREQAEQVEYGRKQEVVGDGDPDRYTYFIEQGSARTYVMREERCIILAFGFEGAAATVELGLRPMERCDYFIETMEPSTLIRIPREHMERLFASHIELANWGRRKAEHALNLYLEYFTDFCWKDKGKQYRNILQHYPELLHRVSLKDLASYLYITPQTLSRIRAGIK